MPDYDEKQPFASSEYLNPYKQLPPPFDFERLTRFMAYGFIMSPVQYQWFGFLNRTFQITKQRAALPALQRVCFDQLIFAPIGKPICWLSGSAILMRGRAGVFLHIHDGHRRRGKESSGAEVPGRISPGPESEFHALAGRTVCELLHHSAAIPDC